MRGYYRGYRGRSEGGWERPGRPYQADQVRREETENPQRYEPRPREDFRWENLHPEERPRRDNQYGHQAGWDEPERNREYYEPHWQGPGPQYRPREDYEREEQYSRGPMSEYPTRPYEEEGPFGRDWEERERRWHEARREEYGREDRHYREELGWEGNRPQHSSPPPRRGRPEPSRWY